MLRELIRDELVSSELVPLNQDKVEAVSKEVTETLWWCTSRVDHEVCSKFFNLIFDAIRTISKLRIIKRLSNSVDKNYEGADVKLLNNLPRIIEHYYIAQLLGLMDSEGNVIVEVLKDLIIGGTRLRAGTVTSISIDEAVFLEALGAVKITGIDLLSSI